MQNMNGDSMFATGVRVFGDGVVFEYEKGTVPGVDKVVYNDPATVVIWSDGTKTVVKCHEGDVYDEREGFLLCCAKKLFGNARRYNDVLAKNAPADHGAWFSTNQVMRSLR